MIILRKPHEYVTNGSHFKFQDATSSYLSSYGVFHLQEGPWKFHKTNSIGAWLHRCGDKVALSILLLKNFLRTPSQYVDEYYAKLQSRLLWYGVVRVDLFFISLIRDLKSVLFSSPIPKRAIPNTIPRLFSSFVMCIALQENHAWILLLLRIYL